VGVSIINQFTVLHLILIETLQGTWRHVSEYISCTWIDWSTWMLWV